MAEYPGQSDRDYAGSLPNVSDPESTFADILRQDYNDYVANFQGYEDRLLGMVNDDSLIRRSRENAKIQSKIAEGVRRRSLSRYGGGTMSAARDNRHRARCKC